MLNIVQELEKYSQQKLNLKNLDEVNDYLKCLEDSETLPEIVCTISEFKHLLEINSKITPILEKVIKRKSNLDYIPPSSHNTQNSEKSIQTSMRSYSTRSNSSIQSNNETKDFTCDLCGKTYYSLAKLNWHKKSHNKSKTRRLLCNHCDFQTDRLSNLNQHKDFAHHRDKTLGCKDCDISPSANNKVVEKIVECVTIESDENTISSVIKRRRKQHNLCTFCDRSNVCPCFLMESSISTQTPDAPIEEVIRYEKRTRIALTTIIDKGEMNTIENISHSIAKCINRKHEIFTLNEDKEDFLVRNLGNESLSIWKALGFKKNCNDDLYIEKELSIEKMYILFNHCQNIIQSSFIKCYDIEQPENRLNIELPETDIQERIVDGNVKLVTETEIIDSNQEIDNVEVTCNLPDILIFEADKEDHSNNQQVIIQDAEEVETNLQEIINYDINELNEAILINNMDFRSQTIEIRRSVRTPANVQKENENKFIEEVLNANSDNGLNLDIVNIPGKNRAVFSTKEIKKGQFIVEYSGVLITEKFAKKREEKYCKDQNCGSFQYFFKHNIKLLCIDPTSEEKYGNRLGRLLNHSSDNPNVSAEIYVFEGNPRLIFRANQNIESFKELTFDYNDHSKESIKNFPFLAKKRKMKK